MTPHALEAALDGVTLRLAWAWVARHSAEYAHIDAPPPRWAPLLRRYWAPSPQEPPLYIDRFMPPLRRGNLGVWTLMGQAIGPVHDPEQRRELTLPEYQRLWAEGLEYADLFRAQAGRHPAHLPWLWTLEAPPPHFYHSER